MIYIIAKEKLNNNVLILSFNRNNENFEYKELTYMEKIIILLN